MYKVQCLKKKEIGDQLCQTPLPREGNQCLLGLTGGTDPPTAPPGQQFPFFIH